MNAIQIIKLVDKGYELDRQIKELSQELEAVKLQFRQESVKTGAIEYMGSKSKCVLTSRSEVSINVRQLHKLLKDRENEPAFFGMVKASVQEVRKALDEVDFAAISTMIPATISVSFK